MENIQYQVEEKEASLLEVSIVVPGAQVKRESQRVWQETAAKATLKGFRKGKIPQHLIQKHYAGQIQNALTQSLLEKASRYVLSQVERKPLFSEQPFVKEGSLRAPQPLEETFEDFSFTLVYETMPQVVVPTHYQSFSVRERTVVVDEEDVTMQLENLRQERVQVLDKAPEAVAQKGDVLTVNYQELDEKGDPVEGSQRENFTFTLGETPTYYHFEEEVMGLRVNQEKIWEKSYPPEEENERLRGTTVRLKLFVVALRTKQLPELNDDFARSLSPDIPHLDALKHTFKKRLEAQAKADIEGLYYQEFFEKLVQEAPIALPSSLVQLELNHRWQGLAQQYRLSEAQLEQVLQESGTEKKALLQKWEEPVKKDIAIRLLFRKIVAQEGLELSADDRKNLYQEQAQRHQMDEASFKEYVSKEKLEYALEEQGLHKRFMQFFKGFVQFEPGSVQSYRDFLSTKGQ